LASGSPEVLSSLEGGRGTAIDNQHHMAAFWQFFSLKLLSWIRRKPLIQSL
jgi:hypothetical protein